MADIRINSLPSTATSFNTDDYIAIDGASAGTRKMLAATLPLTDVTFGTSGPSAKSSIAARAARQGLVFDGTAGATCPNVNLSGTAGFTVAAWITVNSLAANNVIVDGAGGAFALYVGTDGRVSRLDRVTGLQVATPAGVITTGKMYAIAYVRGAIYVDGILQASFTDTSNYAGYIRRVGWAESSDSYATGYISAYIYNRALTAAEVVRLYEAGVPSGADYNTASNTNLSTSAFTAYNTTSFTGVSATGFTAVSSAACEIDTNPNFAIAVGQRIRATFSITVNSGTVYGVLAEQGVGAKSATSVTFSTGTYSIELVATGASSNAAFIFSSTGASNFVVSSFSAVRAGLLLAPDAAQAGGGLTWYDTSGNAANITLPASGVTWNVPSSLILGGKWTVATPVDTTGMFNLLPSGGDYFALTLNNRSSGAAAASRRWIIGNNWNNNGDLSFLQSTSSTSTSYNTMGTFAATGNLLIGTTIDGGQKLQVNGTASFAGAVTAGSTITSSIAGAGAGFRIERTGGSASLGTILNTGGEIVHDYNSLGYSFRVSTVEKFNINATRALFTGKINAANLPTSASGLSAGDIWNDGGTLKIV